MSSSRGRAYRRDQSDRARARARRIVRLWGGAHAAPDSRYRVPDAFPAWFGVCVSTHCLPAFPVCTQSCCRPPRLQVRRADLDLADGLADAGLD
jgi:hypothetical protein